MKFTTELIEGHKQVTALIVPFDPEQTWGAKPIKIDPARDGWLVTGTLNGLAFDGWIGYRWGRFFIIVEPDQRAAAGVEVGDAIEVEVSPTTNATALANAKRQAKNVSAPSHRRRR